MSLDFHIAIPQPIRSHEYIIDVCGLLLQLVRDLFHLGVSIFIRFFFSYFGLLCDVENEWSQTYSLDGKFSIWFFQYTFSGYVVKFSFADYCTSIQS